MADKKLRNAKILSLPSEGETIAITLRPKTGALVYDRVWSPFGGSRFWLEVPDPIRCYGGTFGEFKASLIISGIQKEFRMEEENVSLMGTVGNDAKMCLDTITKVFSEIAFRDILESFLSHYRLFMVPVYDSREHRDKEYFEGNREVIITSLANLQIVDEQRLTWEQVREFRVDKDARQKYRRFVHWLDKEMVGKTQAFIEDEISQRLEDYEWALKKHGIKTVLGTVEEALDGKYLIGASGLALAGYPILGLLGAGLLVSGKVAVKVAQTKLALDDVEHGPNSEISWVYAVRQLDK